MALGKSPQPANNADDAVLTVNERILKQIAEAYSKTASKGASPLPGAKCTPGLLKAKEDGILAICQKLGLSCIAPRRKINVMIVGNHSAGKSSYIKCAHTPRSARMQPLSTPSLVFIHAA